MAASPKSKIKASAPTKQKFEVYVIKNNEVESKKEFNDKEAAQEFVDSYNKLKDSSTYASIVY